LCCLCVLDGDRYAFRLIAFVFQRFLRGCAKVIFSRALRKIAIPPDHFLANGDSYHPLRFAGVPGYFSAICLHLSLPSNLLSLPIAQKGFWLFRKFLTAPWSSNWG